MAYITDAKASNNFCIMCKVFYEKHLMNEYSGNSTYIKITYPYSEIKSRLNAFSKLKKRTSLYF